MLLICSPSSVCQEVPGGNCSMSSHGLMPSLINFCAITRTAGLSSLLWHRNTSKISALESCPFTQRRFYRETCVEDKSTSPLPHFNFLAFSHRDIRTRASCAQSLCNRSDAYTASSPAPRSWIRSMQLAPQPTPSRVECVVYSRTRLKGYILGK